MGKLIAIVGGIGSGKSVVSRILTSMGYEVYDTDTKAKFLMDDSDSIKQKISDFVDERSVIDGKIDRRRLGSVVFGDNDKLKRLNSIVHSAVIADIIGWKNAVGDDVCFVETAILKESGLDAYVDAVWHVTAPEQTRIDRVMARNGLSNEEVRQRIASQKSERPDARDAVFTIVNDGIQALTPRVLDLLEALQIENGGNLGD